MRDRTSELYPDISDLDIYLSGSTYVPLKDTVAIQAFIGKYQVVKMIINDNLINLSIVLNA